MVAVKTGLAMLAALPALSAQTKSYSTQTPFGKIPASNAFLCNQLLEQVSANDVVCLATPTANKTASTRIELTDFRLGSSLEQVPADTNPFETLSYSKGDKAKSIKAFTEAVKGDYQVKSNRAARNDKKFASKAIMIYGEEHTDIRIPSIRNNKGVLLTESDEKRLQLSKHQQFEGNAHQHIDLITDEDIQQSYRPFVYALTEFAESMDYEAVQQIRSELKPTDSGHVFINKLLSFVENNFEKAYNHKLEWERPWFKMQHDRLFTLKEAISQDVRANLDKRNDHMITKATEIIAKLDDDESATIVVGARHLKPIAEALNQKFGRKTPVVACLPESVAWPELMPKL